MAATRDRFADQKPGWDTPLMIESHQNGVRTKAMNPELAPLIGPELG